MLKIINLQGINSTIIMDVLIEGDQMQMYKLCVKQDNDIYPVIDSSIPAKYKLYERQARMALRKYNDRELPEEIISTWY